MNATKHPLRHIRGFLAATAIAFAVSAGVADAQDTADTPVLPAGRESLAGQLIVAHPDIADPRFRNAVILMVRHDASGGLGLIVNKPLRKLPLSDVLAETSQPPIPDAGSIMVHYGGPVEPERGMLLHSMDRGEVPTIAIDASYGVTTDPEVLRAIAEGNGPRQSLFVVGYAGWKEGQIESELDHRAWVIAPADEGIVFDDDFETKWRRAYDRRYLAL